MRRRKIDGCPIASALQLIGDKWTMLVVRDLFAGPKRTTELLEDLHPISSRTLMGRLREMEQDELVLRNNYGGLPRRVEYELTERGRRLVPLLEALMKTGLASSAVSVRTGWRVPDTIATFVLTGMKSDVLLSRRASYQNRPNPRGDRKTIRLCFSRLFRRRAHS